MKYFLILFACLFSSVNEAAIVYDNGVTTTNTAIVSQPIARQIVADDFYLDTTTTITGIEWRGRYTRDIVVPNDFWIVIHDDITGPFLPNDLYRIHLGDNVVMSSINSSVFSYTADVSLTLDAGTYWLSIFNDIPEYNPENRWAWIYQGLGGNLHTRDTLYLPYDVTLPARTDFRITTIPLPPALYLFGSGLLGLIGMAKKKSA